MAITRRHFTAAGVGLAAAAALPAARINPEYKGVRLGVQSYSFRDRDVDRAIAAMQDIGLGLVELWSGHVEPARLKREEARAWRLETPLSHFEAVRRKFDDAGIQLYAYNYSFRDDYTDAEIDRGFEMAKALGVKILTASSNVSTARRIDPFARKHKVRVGMHNHSRIHENEFATPDDFAKAMNGMSEYIAINLDIGHFVAAGFDPVDYLTKHHKQIVTLHIKDRKKDQGANMPFGEGDTPIKAVLAVLRDRKIKIPANIEYEYRGSDTVAEVRKSFEFLKSALA